MDVWTRRRLRTLILAMAVGGLAASMSPGVAKPHPSISTDRAITVGVCGWMPVMCWSAK